MKEEKKHKEYFDLDMKWIQHHNPDLVILDDSGREKERIDLSPYDYNGVTNLLARKGFIKK